MSSGVCHDFNVLGMYLAVVADPFNPSTQKQVDLWDQS